jgi:Amt family ammonium transporter
MINSGDTAWVLVSCALVPLMTPGLAFFYGGLVRSNQVLNTMKMSFVSLGLGSIIWALLGYSLAFSSGNAFIGGIEWLGLQNVTAEPNPQYGQTVPHLAFVVFQMMFAVITPALISGAIVGRMRFKAYTLFISLWMLVVYVPLGHWVWGPDGWIAGLGAVDFAGGTVVHVSAGVAALVAALFIGHRQTRALDEAEAAHNVPFVVLGASLLWFGWFGFNAGSALAADGVAALAVTTTMLSAAAAIATWMLVDIWRTGKPQITGTAIAAVVGLVAITPAAGFVTPLSAMFIGAAGAAASYVAIAIIKRSGVDDTLDVFACHGVGGVVGSILTGVFATTAVNSAGADGLLAV